AKSGKPSHWPRASGGGEMAHDIQRLRERLDADHPQPAVGGLPRCGDVVYRDNERVDAGLDGSERLLLGASDRADVAEQIELTGRGDAVAVEQRPAAHAVVDLERERQAGRRSADAVDR